MVESSAGGRPGPACGPTGRLDGRAGDPDDGRVPCRVHGDVGRPGRAAGRGQVDRRAPRAVRGAGGGLDGELPRLARGRLEARPGGGHGAGTVHGELRHVRALAEVDGRVGREVHRGAPRAAGRSGGGLHDAAIGVDAAPDGGGVAGRVDDDLRVEDHPSARQVDRGAPRAADRAVRRLDDVLRAVPARPEDGRVAGGVDADGGRERRAAGSRQVGEEIGDRAPGRRRAGRWGDERGTEQRGHGHQDQAGDDSGHESSPSFSRRTHPARCTPYDAPDGVLVVWIP